MITQSYLGKKKLTYGYQGQKYGFQDKTYGCPYGKKGLLSRNSAVAFFMPMWMVRVFPSAEQGYRQADYNVINSHANFTKRSTGIIFIRFFFILLILSSLNSSTSKWIFSKMVRFIPINPMADSLLGTQLINYIFFLKISEEKSSPYTHLYIWGSLHTCTYIHIHEHRQRGHVSCMALPWPWMKPLLLPTPQPLPYLHPFTFRSKQTSWGQPCTSQLGDKFSIMFPF